MIRRAAALLLAVSARCAAAERALRATRAENKDLARRLRAMHRDLAAVVEQSDALQSATRGRLRALARPERAGPRGRLRGLGAAAVPERRAARAHDTRGERLTSTRFDTSVPPPV